MGIGRRMDRFSALPIHPRAPVGAFWKSSYWQVDLGFVLPGLLSALPWERFEPTTDNTFPRFALPWERGMQFGPGIPVSRCLARSRGSVCGRSLICDIGDH